MLRDLRGEEGSADALRYHRCVYEQRPRRAQVRRRCAVRRWTSRHIAATSSFVGDEEERRRDGKTRERVAETRTRTTVYSPTYSSSGTDRCEEYCNSCGRYVIL